MAQARSWPDQNIFSCSICLDPLEDPVTIPCGHSYCRKCISERWVREEEQRVCSCPQCRQIFTSRPVLRKNTMLEALVEELKRSEPQAAPADHYYAGVEDVACDVCTGRKLKALKSCLVCLASYCETHLQPHYDAAPLRKHKLVEPFKELQENICLRHDEVKKMFCRTDQQSICYLCSVDEHKDHDTVSAAAERTGRRRKLEKTQKKIQQVIQGREENMKVLQKETEAIELSGDKAVTDSDELFAHLIHLLEKRHVEVKQQVRSKQEAEIRRVQELQIKLAQEITELKGRDAEIQKVLDTPDHKQDLRDLSLLPPLDGSTRSSRPEAHPLGYFKDTMAASVRLADKIQQALMERLENLCDVSLPPPEPTARLELMKYACDITLDPNTANGHLVLSEGNRKVTTIEKMQPYPDHPDRFTECFQVLSNEGLRGQCYWEMKCKGAAAHFAVGYKNTKRTGSWDECAMGFDDKSWALCYDNHTYTLFHNKVQTPLTGPRSCRVGVYLDHGAGILSFYSVAAPMTLLHRVQTTFNQPLHVGVWFSSTAASKVEIINLK